MEHYVSDIENSNRSISETAISRTRKLIGQSELLLSENKKMQIDMELLRRENEDLHFLCRKNQLLNKDYDDFNHSMKLKSMPAETMDLTTDIPFFPNKPIWQQMKRKTEVSAKIQNVFSKQLVASKSVKDLHLKQGTDGSKTVEIKEFISNKGDSQIEKIKQNMLSSRDQKIDRFYDEVYDNTSKPYIVRRFEWRFEVSFFSNLFWV